jgi:ABC-type multidrug transport system ATPase subunit
LECENVWLRHGAEVLCAGLNLRIRAGSHTTIADPSGAAKTALVRIVCGLSKPDHGQVRYDGRPASELTPAQRQEMVAYVAHDVVVLPSATLNENLRFWTRHTGLPPASHPGRIREVLALTGLTGFAGLIAEQCTGGVLRLLSLAVSLLHRPKLLVLDDAGHGIDEQSRMKLCEVLCRAGAAVLYTCRDLSHARSLPGRPWTMHQGRLVPMGL